MKFFKAIKSNPHPKGHLREFTLDTYERHIGYWRQKHAGEGKNRRAFH
jgi:hypothetical protein